jgi:hypothetical protein
MVWQRVVVKTQVSFINKLTAGLYVLHSKIYATVSFVGLLLQRFGNSQSGQGTLSIVDRLQSAMDKGSDSDSDHYRSVYLSNSLEREGHWNRIHFNPNFYRVHWSQLFVVIYTSFV